MNILFWNMPLFLFKKNFLKVNTEENVHFFASLDSLLENLFLYFNFQSYEKFNVILMRRKIMKERFYA